MSLYRLDLKCAGVKVSQNKHSFVGILGGYIRAIRTSAAGLFLNFLQLESDSEGGLGFE